ncbi:hypothetical protein NL676_038588 [Syzygium grande]|nr:hypothetical protein NL676_038588 [Syzygium grande]
MGDTNTRRNLPELFELVRDDLTNGLHTLNFCVTLENCLKYVRDIQLLIFDMLHCFEEEDRKGDCRYSDTLEKLTKFRETRDPLTEFFEIFQFIHKQQKSMLEKLQIKKEEIDEKLKSIRTWAIVSNIILIATFQALLIYSVVTAVVVAPPFTATIHCRFSGSSCLNHGFALQAGTFVTFQVLDTIRVLIDRLEVQIKSLLQIADFAIEGGPEAVKLGIEDIRKKLRDHEGCRRTGKASRQVLQRIMKPPTN